MAFSATRMLMAAAGVSVTPPVTTGASVFTASSTSSNIAISGSITGSSTGIFSCWVKFAAFQGANNSIWFNNRGSGVSIVMGSTGLLTVTLGAGAGFAVRDQNPISTSTWYNILLSWNTNFGSGSKIFNMYINGAARTYDILSDGAAIPTNNYNPPFYIGPSDLAASDSLNACATEVYFAPGQFLDFTNPSNVALFYAGGTPANLGSNGQTPTGSAPAVYWHGVYNNLTNLGTLGGSFTASGDALTACGSYPAFYAANNGNSTLLKSTATPPADAYTGSISLWFNLASTTINSGYDYLLGNNGNNVFGLYITSTTQMRLFLSDSGGTNYLYSFMTIPTLSANTWYNLLISWNTNFAFGSRIIHAYLNGSSLGATDGSGAGSAFQTHNPTLTIYAAYNAGAPSSCFNGCMSEVWYAVGQYIDFTNSANRALFYNAGNPVNLGTAGQTPTGTSPSYYWKGEYNVLTNLGTAGGTYTQQQGTLTACGTAP